LINNRRHYRLSIFLLVQYYNSIPLQIRRLTTAISLFKPANKKELERGLAGKFYTVFTSIFLSFGWSMKPTWSETAGE